MKIMLYFCSVKSVVYIPSVTRDERIGSVFNQLFCIMQDTDNAQYDDVIWDFSYCSFLHTSFLTPLAMYRAKTHKRIELQNAHTDIKNYLTAVCFNEFLDVNDNADLEKVLQNYISKSYIPICRFSRTNENIDEMQTIIQRVIEKQIVTPKLTTPLSYLLSELVGNITDHSKCKHGYLSSQYYSTTQTLDISIIDDGITIYGSYLDSGKFADKFSSEAEALRLAIKGYSTKDRPDAENRGHGISTSMKMLVDGLGGAFFILSGGAFFRYMSNGIEQIVNLPKEFNYNGTAVLLRIPIDIPNDFYYMNYVM